MADDPPTKCIRRTMSIPKSPVSGVALPDRNFEEFATLGDSGSVVVQFMKGHPPAE